MTKPDEPEAQKLRDLIAEIAADLSTENPFWTAKLLADALITRGIGIAPANPVADAGGVTDADREAAAKCVEHGLSRPNPLNVRQGVVDSWHLVKAFAAHRLQSVAAATAAKDARIVRLEDAINRAAMRFDLAAENGRERAETYRKWASEARAALYEAREAGD